MLVRITRINPAIAIGVRHGEWYTDLMGSRRRKVAIKPPSQPVKDEGSLYAVVDGSGRPFYLLRKETPGVTKGEAHRLSQGLVDRSYIVPVEYAGVPVPTHLTSLEDDEYKDWMLKSAWKNNTKSE
jgi:hypothetical protein